MSGAYISVDWQHCLERGHRLKVIGSDKSPMKRSLTCVTCTDANPGKTVMIAHGVDTESWGTWRRFRPPAKPAYTPEEDDEIRD